MTPARLRLSRARGWRLPDNAVNVARPGKWGNPFTVGKDGTRQACVEFYALLVGGGLFCLTCPAGIDAQRAALATVRDHIGEVRGRDLACWCALDGGPCHADVLLALANEPRRAGMLDRFLPPPP